MLFAAISKHGSPTANANMRHFIWCREQDAKAEKARKLKEATDKLNKENNDA